jgi:hypothetical protein
MLPFSLKRVPAGESPPGSPTGPLWREIPAFRAFLPLNISLFIFPSESPVREPPPCSPTGSPWAAILRHQSLWSTFHSFIHSFIHSCLLVFPIKGALLHTYEEKHKGHRPRSPTQTECLHTMECGQVPQGRCRGYCCTLSHSMSHTR